MANNYSYSNYSMNINNRSLQINEDSFKEKVNQLNHKVSCSEGLEKEITKYQLESLVTQYEDYTRNKIKSKQELQGRRRIIIGELMQDRHSMLASSGICTLPNRYTYQIDLTTRLDILLAVTFNLNLVEVSQRLTELCLRKNISLEHLSILVLANDIDMNIACPFTIGDLCEISEELDNFLRVLLNKRINFDEPMLSNIDVINYSEMYEVPEESEIPTAIMFKLLVAGNRILQWVVVEFYNQIKSQNINGMVWSQYLCGLVLNTSEKLSNQFIYKSEQCSILLPLKLI